MKSWTFTSFTKWEMVSRSYVKIFFFKSKAVVWIRSLLSRATMRMNYVSVFHWMSLAVWIYSLTHPIFERMWWRVLTTPNCFHVARYANSELKWHMVLEEAFHIEVVVQGPVVTRKIIHYLHEATGAVVVR